MQDSQRNNLQSNPGNALDDARLARLVEKNLNELFAGHFEVREIHWSLPFHFIIDDVAIDDPEGRPAIRAPMPKPARMPTP